MTTFLIKIDLNSIKKNKNFGETRTVINTNKIVNFRAVKLPVFFKNKENCLITSYDVIDNIKTNFEGEIISDEVIERCIEEKINDVIINIEYKPIYIYHNPIPKYSFTYENTEIICNECGEKIMSDDLKHEESENGDYYSDKICPNCGEFDCCNLKYQNINDVL